MTADQIARYRELRYWFLHEILRVTVAAEIGSMAAPAAKKERRQLQRELAALRSKGE
jgi:hypothetical protein